MTNASIAVRPVSAAVGAEILGLDLADSLPDATIDAIRRALFQHGVVFFRDQKLTPEQHVAFAQRFGAINVNRFFKTVDGYPMIAEVRKEPDQVGNIGGGWHTDHSYDQLPAMGSILYAREVPETGGDTLFASMYAAYDALSDGLKRTLEGLQAFHSSRHVFGVEAYAGRGDLKGTIRESRGGDTGRRASGRRAPSRLGAQGALRELGVHGALRRLDRRGITTAAAIPLSACGARSSPIASSGATARSRSGTTAAPGTTRSTTTTAIAG